jgi:hypothetical protein
MFPLETAKDNDWPELDYSFAVRGGENLCLKETSLYLFVFNVIYRNFCLLWIQVKGADSPSVSYRMLSLRYQEFCKPQIYFLCIPEEHSSSSDVPFP